MALYVFAQIQPLLFMTVCAPIRNALTNAITAASNLVLQLLFFTKSSASETNELKREKTLKQFRNQANVAKSFLLIGTIAFLVALILINGFAFAESITVQKSQNSFENHYNQMRLKRFSAVKSFGEIPSLKLRDNKLDCYLKRGYPNEDFQKCYYVFPSPVQLHELFYDEHLMLCSNMSLAFFYPITMQEIIAVDAVLRSNTGNRHSKKLRRRSEEE